MDLVAGIRKEGSRGGRDSFKWSDVKDSSHRENYLGHSLMAPVGRWQQGRDLNWYAKNKHEGDDSVDKEKQDRAEELRRVKEAEQDAMARALGLPVAPRSSNNANLTPLGGNEVQKAIQEATGADDKDEEGGRGIGFGSYGGLAMNGTEDETLAAVGMESQARTRRYDSSDRDRSHRSRRNRSRDADRRRVSEREPRDHRARSIDRDRSDYHHRRHRDQRDHRDHRNSKSQRSVSRSRSPRRDHQGRHHKDSRERRYDSDRRRDRGSRRDRDSDRSYRDRRN